VDVQAAAATPAGLLGGAARGRAGLVVWLVHLLKRFLRGYEQLDFKESWLCPSPGCNLVAGLASSPEFAVTLTSVEPDHDCHAEGCWHFLGGGHELDSAALTSPVAVHVNGCPRCDLAPKFNYLKD
jgi:hypothetical protein